jgi:transposase InsO family protein
MVEFIDAHRGVYGVEPICRVLPIAPSTYYEEKAREADPTRLPIRAQRDEVLRGAIRRVWDENFKVYGVRKMWRQLKREKDLAQGPVARCTVARLMQEMGLWGAVRGRKFKTTVPDSSADRPADLVKREFTAAGPNQLRRSTNTYDRSNMPSLRRPLEPGQYLSIRYTERLEEAGIAPSVGSKGDSYDNAMAETVIGLYKTELIQRRGPWRNLEEVEFATLEWVAWYNTGRLFGPIAYISPVEYEEAYSRSQQTPAILAGVN